MSDPAAVPGVPQDQGPGAKFQNWPENLPREDLVRMLRGYAQTSMRIEQRIAAVFPDRFPLGDGDIWPEDQRLVVDEDAEAMAELACEEIARLSVELAEARAEVERLRGTDIAARDLFAVPAPTETRTEWGTRWTAPDGVVTDRAWPHEDGERDAREHAARWPERCEVIVRDVPAPGPWRPAPAPSIIDEP